MPIQNKRNGWLLAKISIATNVFLMALVCWFSFYLAGATIDKGTFYTGAVGATFGAFLFFGFILSALSTALAIGTRVFAGKISEANSIAWKIWFAAHALFIVGIVASATIVHINLK